MSLLIDVREVPWRILEMVQARILANRESKARRQQASDVRKHTRPRPQQRRMGATMSTYREPEPVPLVLDDLDKIAVAVWSSDVTIAGTNETTTYRISNAAKTGAVELSLTTPLMRDNTPTITNVFEGDFFGYDGTATFTYTAHSDGSRRTTDYFGFLPVGNGSIVFVAIQRTALTRGEYSNYQRREATSRINQYGLRLRKTVTTEITSASYYVEESNTVRCALVTRAGVREIQPSAAILAGIQASYPPTSGWDSYEGTTVANIGDNGMTILEDVEVDGGTGVILDQVTLNTMTPYTTSYPYKQPPAGKRGYPLQGLARHYGMGDLTTSNHGSTRYWTPAEFGQLRPFGGVDYGTDDYAANLRNYQQFRTTFLAGTPAPTSYLDACLTPGSCPVEFETFFRTRQAPVDIFTAMDPALFRPVSRRVSTPPLQSGEHLAFVWDWGQPAFCRQQLLALGFTEADLTP